MEEINLVKSDFLKVLEAGGIFAGKNRTLPILSCVKIHMTESQVSVLSGDNENWVCKRKNMNTGISKDISFCVDFKNLFSYIKLIPGEYLTMSLENGMLTVKHKKGKTSMPTSNPEDYPQISSKDEYTKVMVPSYLVNNWIMDAKSFVREDDLRPIMGSIYFYCEKGELGCCASDGSCLYWNHSSYEGEDFNFTLNKGAFDAVCKLCSDCEEVSIEIGSNNVKFRGGGTYVLARKVEGRFPNFKSVIPKNNSILVETDKKEMIEAINRCRLSADSKSPIAKLFIDGMEMQICCEDIDFDRSSVESIMVDTNGSITIGLDCNILLELLKTIITDRVQMCFSEPNRAMVMKESNDSDKLLLLMPMQLNETK